MKIIQYNHSDDMTSGLAYNFRIQRGNQLYKWSKTFTGEYYWDNMGSVSSYKEWIRSRMEID